MFLGAEPGFRLPQGWKGDLHCVQGFRPHFVGLQKAGYAVAPRAEGKAFEAALVLAGRHRGRSELDIAEALERAVPGGLVLVAGSKDDGIASLRKRLAQIIDIEGSEPKYHGVAFWFRRPRDLAAAAALRQANPDMLVGGRFHTRPGMFSFDRVDAGSRLLSEALPGDLKGAVADFCAGWGYLSAAIQDRCAEVTSLDLYEADLEALDMARRNVDASRSAFHWSDLLSEEIGRRFDAVVMNPPFHRGRAAEPDIGTGMIRAASRALKPGGRLLMVANRRLPYEQVLVSAFKRHVELAGDGAFKVLAAWR